MRRLIMYLLLLTGFSTSLSSQIITGRVYDKDTGNPIPLVSVYLDDTSIHTKTDDKGEFQLSAKHKINTDLIFTHVGYNMIIISNPFDANLEKVYLTEKDNTLDDIVVVSDEVMTRAEKLKLFREEFLGKTKAGKSCKILNEDDILLRYNSKDKELTASSEKPIIIENVFLGYKITYNLVAFRVKYVKGPLQSIEPNESYIRGTSIYENLAVEDRNMKSRRKSVYKNSPVFFFKNFANSKLKEEGYTLYNEHGVEIEQYRYFTVKDSLSMKKISIIDYTDITRIPEFLNNWDVKALMDVRIGGGNWSRLIFLTDSFLVDQWGNSNAVEKIILSGYFGTLRIGDMLPLDYEL